MISPVIKPGDPRRAATVDPITAAVTAEYGRLETVRAAPPVVDEMRETVVQMFKREIEFRGIPNFDALLRGDTPLVSEMVGRNIEGLFFRTIWLIGAEAAADKIVKSLATQGGISHADRAAKIAEHEAELYRLSRAEEFAISALEAENPGCFVVRRENFDPKLVLLCWAELAEREAA